MSQLDILLLYSSLNDQWFYALLHNADSQEVLKIDLL